MAKYRTFVVTNANSEDYLGRFEYVPKVTIEGENDLINLVSYDDEDERLVSFYYWDIVELTGESYTRFDELAERLARGEIEGSEFEKSALAILGKN